MSRRTHEGPMDFEYQNGTGPMDSRSPFASVGTNVQRMPAATQERAGFKRSYSAFESPARPSHTQPQHSSTQPSSPSKNRPPIAAYNALFSTPRKIASHIDDSSAGETPKSPSRDDSDATPDTTALKTAKSRLDISTIPQLPAIVNTMERRSPDRRDSFFAKLKKSLYSPGRGEVPRGDMTHVKESRVRKIKSRDGRHRHGRGRRNSASSASDDDTNRRGSPRKSPRKVSSTQAAPEHGPMTRLFRFIQAHPTVPHILSFYAQLLFNVFLLSGCAYVIYSFWAAIQADIDKKSWTEIAQVTAEINKCSENYRINGCNSPNRAPALMEPCDSWSLCMAQDPRKVARARISAYTVAEVFNSFIEPISWKAMIFTAVIVIGCFAVSNCAFGFLRAKTAEATHYNPQQWQAPQTPHGAYRGQGDYYGGTPWNTHTALEPAPSTEYGQIEGRGSPVRRLAY